MADEVKLAFGKDGKAVMLNEEYTIYCADKENFEKVKKAVEKQIPKKPKHIHEEYEKHQWKRDENGNIDEWTFEVGFCNGVSCERCYTTHCIHCNPDYDNEPCIVDKYVCPNCETKVYSFKKEIKYCEICGQALDWSDTKKGEAR